MRLGRAWRSTLGAAALAAAGAAPSGARLFFPRTPVVWGTMGICSHGDGDFGGQRAGLAQRQHVGGVAATDVLPFWLARGRPSRDRGHWRW